MQGGHPPPTSSAYEEQQVVVREERSTRLRLGLSGSRTARAVMADGGARDGADAPAEVPTTAEGSSLELGFGLLAWSATPLLGSLTAMLGDTLAALGADETGFEGGRCCDACNQRWRLARRGERLHATKGGGSRLARGTSIRVPGRWGGRESIERC